MACFGKPKPEPEPAKPEFVDYEDAKAALEAANDLQRSRSDVQVKELTWQKARARLIEKYGIDPDQNHGWDFDLSGRLKARRHAPEPAAKK